ncbi:hypothetical protein [Microbispora sp. ATCC PTA-5024]|uniref:hypothetical protein n=1 Tax=Microbispora sp. ATCC PTA-5024 TaxID=316330 RepID=UPI0012ECBBA4|nr:hypothetical protein [Microbispora sp. ATCC PTA-5024]
MRNIEVPVPAVGTAGNDQDTAAFVAPFDSTVTSVTYVPSSAVTGAATNNRTISLVNKGQSGSGTTSVASLTFSNGTNAAAYDETAVTLSGTSANLDLAAGDVLQWRSVHNGTGITDPGGFVRVTLSRR